MRAYRLLGTPTLNKPSIRMSKQIPRRPHERKSKVSGMSRKMQPVPVVTATGTGLTQAKWSDQWPQAEISTITRRTLIAGAAALLPTAAIGMPPIATTLPDAELLALESKFNDAWQRPERRT
jgi:hypothetical protein